MNTVERFELLKNIGFSRLEFLTKEGLKYHLYTFQGKDKGFKSSEIVNMSEAEFNKLTYKYIN